MSNAFKLVKDPSGTGLFYNPEESVTVGTPYTMYIRFHTPGATATKANLEMLMTRPTSFADVARSMQVWIPGVYKMSFELEDGSETKLKYIYVSQNEFANTDSLKRTMVNLRNYFLSSQDIEKALKEILVTFDNVLKAETDQVLQYKWFNTMYSPKFRLKFDTPDDKTAKLDAARQMILDSYDPKEIPENPVLHPFPPNKNKKAMVWGLILVLLATAAVGYYLMKEKKSKKNQIQTQTEQFGRYRRNRN